MRPSDIVVTGLGVWSSAGTSPQALLDTSLSGHSPAQRMGSDDPTAVCRCPPPPAPEGFPQAHRMDRSVHLALAAAIPAFRDARLGDLDPARIAVLVGNARGPVGKLTEPPQARVRPTQAAHTSLASLSGALSLALRIQGPCLTVSAACASGAHAMVLGASLLECQMVDAVLAGGAEAPLVPHLLRQYAAAGILGSHPDPARACRPFDATRNGTVLGEGAAFLVLERAPGARARGVAPKAHLAGFAAGAESHNRVAARADGEGLVRVIHAALDRAGVPAEAIGYINAHGTGTPVNDLAEAAAYRRVFGERTASLPISSTKAVTGHALGAAAALEAVLTVEALTRRLVPSTCGCHRPDPDLGLDIIVDTPRILKGRWVMSTSLGFWGNTACLIFGPPDGS